jgi:hypothetical protein
VLENLRERVEVSARVIIDATGDGDIAAAAGASRHPLVVQKIFHTVPFPAVHVTDKILSGDKWLLGLDRGPCFDSIKTAFASR